MCDNIAIVRWRDHYSNDGWTDPDHFEPEDYVVTTIGFPVVENDLYLCIAGSYSDSGMANSIMCILKTDILSREQKYESDNNEFK